MSDMFYHMPKLQPCLPDPYSMGQSVVELKTWGAKSFLWIIVGLIYIIVSEEKINLDHENELRGGFSDQQKAQGHKKLPDLLIPLLGDFL